MSENTETPVVEEEESSVIQQLRAEVKAAKALAKSAASEARAEISREAAANSLIPEAYKALVPYFVQEVDGDLTKEAADKWLADKGLTASPAVVEETAPVVDPAVALEEVTNLGGQIAAASAVTPDDSFAKALNDTQEGLSHIGDLPTLTSRIEALLGDGSE